MFLRFSFFVFIISAFSILPSFAQDYPKLNHKVLKEFKNNGGTVKFLGHAFGMDGWAVINPKGRVQYVYTNDDGAAVAGMLFDPSGKPETLRQIRAFKERSKGGQGAISGADKSSVTSKAEKFYTEVESSNWVSLGNKDAPYIYTFINTECGTCQNFWKEIQSAVKDGKIQVRLIPTGKKPDNYNGGAALLASSNPYKTWTRRVAGDKQALNINNVKKEHYTKINLNNKLIVKWKIPDTPFTIYRKVNDGKITAIVGIPKNMMLLFSDLIKVDNETTDEPKNNTKTIKKHKEKKHK